MAGQFRALTDELIAAARTGISTEYREQPPCFSVLTRDVIRRWAYAIGDGNPLWLDEEYARQTRWGAILSPPTFPETAVRGPLFNPLLSRRGAGGRSSGEQRDARASRRGSTGTGLPGIAALQAGRQFTFYAPVRANDEMVGKRRTVAIVDSCGRVEGDCIEPDADVEQVMETAKQEVAARDPRIVIQTFEIKIYNKNTGQLVLRDFLHESRFERGCPLEESKYGHLELPKYSDEEMQKIIATHENEYLRGSEVLYWEDVKVGDQLPGIVKGPHTPFDHVMYHSAFGAWFDVTDRLKYLLLQRFPGSALVDPETNVPEFLNTMHFDGHVSRSLGFPRGFDGSMQRISWFGHMVTNWMGDDAFLRNLDVYQLQPLFLYDTAWLHGRVVAKNEEDASVRMELWGDNQRGEAISQGSAVVVLQTRSGKPFPYR